MLGRVKDKEMDGYSRQKRNFRLPKKPSMQRRCMAHDYHAPCIYLITIRKSADAPCFGRLVGTGVEARIELSPVGEVLNQSLLWLPQQYPQVALYQYQVMPDHLHMVVHIKERLPQGLPLGNIVAAFKAKCSKGCRDLNLKAQTPNMVVLKESGPATFRSQQKPRPIFESGFNDSILTGKGQLKSMLSYVRDNPRRLSVKRDLPELFRIHRKLVLAGVQVDAVGNMDLLRRPMMAVHCRRMWSEEQTRAHQNACILAARKGTVLVGAFISKTEKAVLRKAQDEGLPVVHVQKEGFSERYKPIGRDFENCAAGLLLQLTPFEYDTIKTAITRQQCQQLNRMAESLASGQCGSGD